MCCNSNKDLLEENSQGVVESKDILLSRFKVELSKNICSCQTRQRILDEMKFGKSFTDHMASATWSKDEGWHDKKIRAYENITLSPAAAILHYGQEVFEGLKAYRYSDNSIWTFRPKYNAVRFNMSAERMCMPTFDVQDFIASIVGLVNVDKAWVPKKEGSALYLRPFMYADEPFLGVRASNSVQYLCIASPVGPYFGANVKDLEIWVDKTFHRAGPGGTGFAKTAGNYAAAMLPQENATSKGFNQVCFLDSVSNRYLEELGGMNVFVVYSDGSIATPALTGTILEGSTRSSIITLLEVEGVTVKQKHIDIDELVDDIRSNKVAEMFACGTAAVIAPIGRLASEDFDVRIPSGDVTKHLYNTLTGIQKGVLEDKFGWMYKLSD